MARRPINAMDRDPVRQPLDTGVRAINALLTVGRGQRIGLFAGTGVGKSVLLGMMARYTAADVIVVGLIGERGREVKEFIEDILGPEGRKRSVVVAAPADAPPLVRLQGASYATAIAEHFRDKGQHVLLLMDSLTRYAMAQREIALAIGEPPATKGYPPSVFAKLPQLVERSGNGLHGVVQPDQVLAARKLRQWLARVTKARDLIQLGAYSPGSDPELDMAVRQQPQIEALLQQDMHDRAGMDASRAQLRAVTGL